MTEAENAAIYVRVSTKEQAEEGESLDAQLAKLGAYCRMRGLVVAHELVERGVTTKRPLSRRPEGQKLLALVRSRAIGAVVIWSLDRAFRNTAECLTVVSGWTKKGVSLHLCNFGGGSIDTSSAVGKMLLTFLAGVAEFERNVNGERTALALRHKHSKHEYLGGEPRYGWRVVDWDPAMPGSGRLVRDDVEQRVIAQAKALRDDGLGTRRIATMLASQGVVSRRGKPFAPVQIARMCAACPDSAHS